MERLSATGVLLLGLLLLSACGDVKKEVTAWPGMDVAEFDHLNKNSARPMKLNGSDWIGINSPVTLVFRQGGQAIQFEGTRMGGGIQVASGDLVVSQGVREAPTHIHTIAFNIGGSMEDITVQEPLLSAQCDRLARMAGTRPKPIPDATALRRKLQLNPGSDVEVCSGRGSTFTFQITAFHNEKHGRYGKDFNRAYFDGYLGLPIN